MTDEHILWPFTDNKFPLHEEYWKSEKSKHTLMCMEIDKISVISVHIYIYMWEYSTSSGYLSKQTIKDPKKQK